MELDKGGLKRKRNKTHLNSETAVDLRLALVVLPNDTELDDTLRDLNDIQSLLVFGVGSQERLQRESELVQSLLEFGLARKVGHVER